MRGVDILLWLLSEKIQVGSDPDARLCREIAYLRRGRRAVAVGVSEGL